LYLDGYLADYYFIDGEALDPSRFGKQDADGIWQPITYTGSYGTNGFHLDFADNSTAAALGTDTSGNGNNWTPSGITTDDQVTDTPSVNYATINPLAFDGTGVTLSNGNLAFTNAVSNTGRAYSTFEFNTGKWYCEVTPTAGKTTIGFFGVRNRVTGDYAAYYGLSGNKFINGVQTAYGASYSLNDVIGIAYDADTGDITFYKNGASQGVFSTGRAGETMAFFFSDGSSSDSFTATTNFGQRPFAYTPPTGFQALNSSNLPAPTITDGKAHFAPAQPDFVWIKNRSGVNNHILSDAVRGAGVGLASDATAAEFSIPTDFQSFDASGFTVGYAGFNFTNGSGINYVAWNWNAGGSTVTNTDGTITSQVRANTDAGISIVSFSYPSSGDFTVGHGLNVAPSFIIAKHKNRSSDWGVYHFSLGKDYWLSINTQGAAISASNFWGTSAVNSSTFGGLEGTSGVSGDQDIAYCFAEVDGFSKFGSYTGNGSADGPFVYTGFRPAFVMVKRTDTSGFNWNIFDTSRSESNLVVDYLAANTSDAEGTIASTDHLSNGFKVRNNLGYINASGGTYIFMAFAENPFKLSRAR
jgi:hypothetical protein